MWNYIEPDTTVTLDFEQFGSGVRTLHEIPVADLAPFNLPWCDEADWLDVERNLALAREANVVPAQDIDVLDSHCRRLRSWGALSRSAGRQVACHGDIHPQNVLSDGRAIIID